MMSNQSREKVADRQIMARRHGPGNRQAPYSKCGKSRVELSKQGSTLHLNVGCLIIAANSNRLFGELMRVACAVIILLVIVLVGNLSAGEQAPSDQLKPVLQKATTDYTHDLSEADKLLDFAVKKIATDGTLDEMKAALQEKNDFQATGKLPKNAVLKSAVSDCLAARIAAKNKVVDKYAEIIAAYAKQSRFDEAGNSLGDLKKLVGG